VPLLAPLPLLLRHCKLGSMTLQEDPEADEKSILLLPHPCFKLIGCWFNSQLCHAVASLVRRFAMFSGKWQNKTSGKLLKPNTIFKNAGKRN